MGKTTDFPSIAGARRRYAHGTHARYVLARCRCKPCAAANARYEHERKIQHTPFVARCIAPNTWTVVDLRRGTTVRRKLIKSEAGSAARDLNAAFRAKHGPGPRELVDAAPIRVHLAKLQDAGAGLKSIAPAAGIASSVLDRYQTGAISRTRKATLDRILALRIEDVLTDGAHVRAEESLVLIDRMIRAGYQQSWIARELKEPSGYLYLAKASPWMTVRKARAIHNLYVREMRRDVRLARIDSTFIPKTGRPTSERSRWRGRRLIPTTTTTSAHGSAMRFEQGCRCTRCAKASREAAIATRSRLRYVLRPINTLHVVIDSRTGKTVYRGHIRARAIATRDALNSLEPGSAERIYVDVKPVRKHIATLLAAGMTRRSIASAARVKIHAVHRALNVPDVRIRSTSATAILAVAIPVDRPDDGRTLTDGSSTWRMLERLEAAGFACAWIEHILGTSFAYRGASIQISRARAVASLYGRLRTRLRMLPLLDRTS